MSDLIKSTLPLSEIMSIGKAFQESGMFTDIKSAAQAIVKIQAGQEMGISPFASMTGINIIMGRPTVGAGIIAAKVKGSGKYNYKIVEHSDKICSIDYYEGKERLGNSSFTIEDAKRAGTKNLDKFPKNMLFARAMSNGQKFYCPDVFNQAVFTDEDFDTEQQTEDVPAVITTPEQPKPEEVKKNTLHKTTSPGLTEDELWQWQQSLNDCINEEELRVLFEKNKSVMNSEPQVYKMMQERKKQLAQVNN